jgi:Na+/melibiose symporter-like transporter
MSCLGLILLFLAFPLIIGYYVGEKKNRSWRNLAFLMGAIGLILIIIRPS